MKKQLIFMFLLALPVLMLALPFSPQRMSGYLGENARMMDGRAWRLSQRVWHYPEGSEWIAQEKMVYSYGTFPNRPQSAIMYAWDGDLQEWVANMNATYQYDNQGFLQEAVSNIVFGEMVIPISRVTAEYNGQHWLTNISMFMGDMPFRTWTPVTRMHITYNGNALSNVYMWEAGFETEPAQYYKIGFNVDGQGRLIEELEQSSPDSLNWVDSSKTVHTYHPADTTTGDQYINWLAWYMPMSFGMFADESHLLGLIVQSTYYDWNNGWVLSDRETNTYTTSSPYMLLSNLDEYWQNNAWMQNYKVEYSYDSNFNPVQSLESEWNGAWQGVAMSTLSWEWAGTSNDDPGVPPAPALRIEASPNPFSSELKIGLDSKHPGSANIQVFNMKGQLVRSLGSTSSSAVWDGRDERGSFAGNGVYLIRAEQNGKFASARVLLLR